MAPGRGVWRVACTTLTASRLEPGPTLGLRFPSVRVLYSEVPFDYTLDAGRPMVALHYHLLASELRDDGVKGTWDVEILIRYPVIEAPTETKLSTDDDIPF